jgi:4-hydroxythreonine-4-phosphate dehydrogenase
MTTNGDDIPLAISSGDPASIGPEIIGKAWNARIQSKLKPFFAVGDINSFAAHWDGPTVQIDDPAKAATHFANTLPVLHIHDCGTINPGQPDAAGAECALRSLELAIGCTRAGTAAALVTAPVSKTQLYSVGFTHPGQTEFIAERCGISGNNAVMMLAGPDLRVVPMTTHIPFSEVLNHLDGRLIRQRIRATIKGLQRDFNIENPRIAIAGINPHAGENGNIGTEELEIFMPSIEKLRGEGYNISDPQSADTLFHAAARQNYDAVMCGYHDQALIPIKTIYFDEAVNITLGLPIVRTSPDHGTAFGIAGQNIARADSMIVAIQMAGEAVAFRKLAAAKSE